MSHALLDSTRQLSDADLLQRVTGLAARERNTMAELVAHLAEVESRSLELRQGYGSLFEYCRVALCFSEHEAYNRSTTAQAARRFPVILDMLTDGSINLTTVRLLAGHITAENHRGVLDAARGKRKSEVEKIVASLAPRPDVPMTVRKLAAPAPPAVSATSMGAASSASATASPTFSFTSGQPPAAPVVAAPFPVAVTAARAQSAITAPLAPDRYRLQVTISGECLQKLRLAADMLGHAVPNGDGAAVIDRALTLLLADLARKKFAATERPRPSRGTPNPASRHIPAEVKRAVWVRDLGRCAFAGLDRRCDERRFLEFHHVKPYAGGGPPTVENIQLRCRRHNQHEARAYFGPIERSRAEEVHEAAASYGVVSGVGDAWVPGVDARVTFLPVPERAARAVAADGRASPACRTSSCRRQPGRWALTSSG
jgi:hypothetical protein